MARKSTPKAAPSKKVRAKRAAARTGRLVARPEISEYRAVESEQTLRVRAEIDAALETARRTREEIEGHIEQEWQNRSLPGASRR
ncbi:hypothetical protein [Stigmatella erecta]|uniref:Uncharacterized protein n=1 Tax=Stigmatella erecta TaxID=83460 RepID=A0A1I0KFE0_9BACT|nr:hypothetical protein [Stigmatella erecta]SEU22294.1 hypothetical protein SAMN05443639_110115 [Stigmatella erecta]